MEVSILVHNSVDGSECAGLCSNITMKTWNRDDDSPTSLVHLCG